MPSLIQNADLGNLDDGQIITDILVTTCDNGSFCYGDGNRDCCQQGGGVFLYNGEQVTFDPNATTISTTSTPSASSTSSTLPSSAAASASATSKPSSKGGLSTGAQAGIGIGVGLLVLLVLILSFLVLRRRKKEKRHLPPELGTDPGPAMLETPKPIHELPSSYAATTPRGPLSELDGSTDHSGSKGNSVKKKDAPTTRYG